MQWTKPDFEEVSLGMEVTAYVNTDEAVKRVGRIANPTYDGTTVGRITSPSYEEPASA